MRRAIDKIFHPVIISACHPDLRQQVCANVQSMSAYHPKAEIAGSDWHVRFVPIGDIAAASAAVLAGSKKNSSHQETGAALQFRAS
jgi:hypothetical protein